MTENLPTTTTDFSPQELDIHGTDSPYSIRNLLRHSPTFLAKVDALPIEAFGCSERILERALKPDSDMRRLKISFWEEYRWCQNTKNNQMALTNVYEPVCSKSLFSTVYMNNPKFVAWLIAPPAAELLVQKELLQYGYKRLAKVLTMKFYETYSRKLPNGKIIEDKRVNVSLIKECRVIVEMLQNRVHGAVIQRQQIEAKTLHVSVNGDDKKQLPPQEMTLDDLDKLEKKLEAVAKKARAAEGIIDVEAETK